MRNWSLAAGALAFSILSLPALAETKPLTPEQEAFATAVAGLTGDAAKGQTVFAACRACHQVGPTAKHAVGPVLNGLFGRVKGSTTFPRYSAAYKALLATGTVWDEKLFSVYIVDPRGVTPGTSMAYAGLKGAGADDAAKLADQQQKVVDLIAFLKTHQDAPLPQ
jgi:cytochrome c